MKVYRDVFRSSEPDRVEYALQTTFELNGLSVRGSTGRMLYAQSTVATDHFSFVDALCGSEGNAHAVVENHDRLSIQQTIAGKYHTAVGRSEIDTSRPWTSVQGPTAAHWDQCRLLITSFDIHQLENFASDLLGTETQRIDFLAPSPAGIAQAEYWSASLKFARWAMSSPETSQHPILVRQAFESLATALLFSFQTTVSEIMGRTAPVAGLLSLPLRRAVSYADDHAHEAVGVAEMARASGLSVRGLQNAFRRELETTPSEYLRRVRLEHAHQELRQTDPTSGVTVRAIAYNWGFAHLSRFATAYRDAFGEFPSATLRR